MEDMQQRHRKEKRDLQSQVTQKKKAATKKNRKSVNDQCTLLEQELAKRQEEELARFEGNLDQSDEDGHDHGSIELSDALEGSAQEPPGSRALEDTLQDLAISTPSTVKESGVKESNQRKPNRQKARLARRAAEQEEMVAKAAEEAALLPDLKEQERTKMLNEFEKRGLKEKEIAANGHCMYSAIADQMNLVGTEWTPKVELRGDKASESSTRASLDYKTMRNAAASYIAAYPNDFTPFLEEPLHEYVQKIRDTGEWGGQLELLALARTYNLSINVIQSDGRVEEIQSGDHGEKNLIWLAYYKHGFGLGEHYNSLRHANPP